MEGQADVSSTIHQLRAGRVRTMGLALTVGALVLGYGATAAQAQSTAPSAAGTVYTVAATTTDLGTFLTGEDGKTLYFFAKDTAPGASACEGGCLDNWPPFLLEGSETLAAGDGVTGVLATFARSDGTMQVAYDGRPVYYFAGDKAAGDVTGQGAGGFWTVALADGSLGVVAPAAASPAAGATVYTVNAVTTDLGTFLTGEDGKTLYYLTKDAAPGASVCEADCLSNWPAFILEANESLAAGAGVTGVLGTFARSDGSMQVSYDGRPVYYFIGDQAAGDVAGQGIGGVWFVAAADGSVPPAS